jgi:hypothetical protein
MKGIYALLFVMMAGPALAQGMDNEFTPEKQERLDIEVKAARVYAMQMCGSQRFKTAAADLGDAIDRYIASYYETARLVGESPQDFRKRVYLGTIGMAEVHGRPDCRSVR